MLMHWDWYINGLVQERYNSIANALELCLSCTNPANYAVTNSLNWMRIEIRIKADKAWLQTFMNLSFVSPDCYHNRDIIWALWCSYHWKLDCLFNSMFRVTTTKSSNLPIIGPLGQIPLVFSSQKENNIKSASMSWHHHFLQRIHM